MNGPAGPLTHRLAGWLVAEDRPRREDLVCLGLLGLVVLGAGLGLRDPWPPDEPRFALVARDMAETGRWLFPRVGGVLYADKPPLFMWLQALLYSATGSLRLSFLLPSAAASIGTLLLTYDLGRRLWDRRTGLSAALVLLCILQFQIQAKSAQIDTTLAFLTTLSLYGILCHLLDGPRWGGFWAGCGAAGLGVITKGVGFLPLLALLPWGWAVRRGWVGPVAGGAGRWAGGAAAFLVAIGVWLVPMLVAVVAGTDPDLAAYRDNILLKQTAERYADAWGHIEPPWYFVAGVIPWAWLPVTAVLPWLVPRWAKALQERDARILVLAAWVVLVVAFFSASAGKRGVYLLPAVPAVALLAAPWARELVGRAPVRRVLFGVTALIVAALAWIAVRPPGAIRRVLEETGTGMPWDVMGPLVAGGLVVLAVFRVRRAAAGLVVATLACWAFLGWYAQPKISDLRSGRPVMEALSGRTPAGAEVGFIQWKEQFLLYLDRPVTHFGYRRPFEEAVADGAAWLAAGRDRLALVGGDHPECFDFSEAISLGFAHRSHWYLVGAGGVDPACGDGRPRPLEEVKYAPPTGHD